MNEVKAIITFSNLEGNPTEESVVEITQKEAVRCLGLAADPNEPFIVMTGNNLQKFDDWCLDEVSIMGVNQDYEGFWSLTFSSEDIINLVSLIGFDYFISPEEKKRILKDSRNYWETRGIERRKSKVEWPYAVPNDQLDNSRAFNRFRFRLLDPQTRKKAIAIIERSCKRRDLTISCAPNKGVKVIYDNGETTELKKPDFTFMKRSSHRDLMPAKSSLNRKQRRAQMKRKRRK